MGKGESELEGEGLRGVTKLHRKKDWKYRETEM